MNFSELSQIVNSIPDELEIKHIGKEILNCRTTGELELVLIRSKSSDDDKVGLIQLVYSTQRLDELWAIASTSRGIVKIIRHLDDVRLYSRDYNPFEKIINAFGNILDAFYSKSLYSAAVGILVELWNELGEYQAEVNKDGGITHIYRAAVAMYLGRLYMRIHGEQGTAMWWLLLAHADDLLIPHPQGGGGARDMLRLGFNVTNDAFNFIRERANEIISNRKGYELFAEHIIVQLSKEPKYSRLFSYPTSLTEFPICRAYVSTMIDIAKTSSSGKILEDLARYLVLLLAGWIPTDNTYHNRTRIDSDLIARYTREPETISTAYGRVILAECKNYDKRLSISQVGYFLYRMHFMNVKVGVLFAANNISGKKKLEEGESNSAYLLELAFQRDGSAVVVIDLDDIKDITENKQTMWSLIDTRITERRFGKPSGPSQND